jgi:hypothetical protein
MSFDKDHQSPDKIVDTGKRTTKVNLVVVLGILILLLAGSLAVWRVVRDPPQNPAEVVGKP